MFVSSPAFSRMQDKYDLTSSVINSLGFDRYAHAVIQNLVDSITRRIGTRFLGSYNYFFDWHLSLRMNVYSSKFQGCFDRKRKQNKTKQKKNNYKKSKSECKTPRSQ